MNKTLQLVVIYPCHGITYNGKHNGCTKLVSEEWWGTTRKDAYKDKRDRSCHFDSVDDAIKHYDSDGPNLLSGGAKVAIYDNISCSYQGPEDSNLNVTGSHTICDYCKSIRNSQFPGWL